MITDTLTSIFKSNPSGLTMTDINKRLPAVHKTEIKQGIKSLRDENRVVKHAATGELAKYLNIKCGTELYIWRGVGK